MFLDRSRKTGPHLEWRIRAFALAAVLGIAGIALEARWMTLSAIVVAVAGLALRFGGGRGGADDEDEGVPEDEDEGGPDDEDVDGSGG